MTENEMIESLAIIETGNDNTNDYGISEWDENGKRSWYPDDPYRFNYLDSHDAIQRIIDMLFGAEIESYHAALWEPFRSRGEIAKFYKVTPKQKAKACLVAVGRWK